MQVIDKEMTSRAKNISFLWAMTLEFGSPTGSFARIAARIEKVTTKLAAPNMSGFLRPTRSRINMMKLGFGKQGVTKT